MMEVTPIMFKREDGLIAPMDGGGSNVSKLNEQMPYSIRLLATAAPSESNSTHRR